VRSGARGAAVRADLVLVGAGHAHVQVLRGLAMQPIAGVRTTLVVDRPEAVYSGMVPGFVAGDYGAGELEIDAVPLARRAGARVVLAPALRVDAAAQRIQVAGRPPLPYDVASLDVGSAVRGAELPGVREHALATRPIGRFVGALAAALARARPGGGGRLRVATGGGEGRLRVAIAGGGAAGVELACTLEARLRAEGEAPEVVLLTDEVRLLTGASARLAAAAERELRRRGIRVRCGSKVEAVAKDGVLVAGEWVPCDLCVWAVGAAPPELVAASLLPKDSEGFVRVRDSFEVEDDGALFAVGDCATLVSHPWVPKAGVYAVRAGPVLAANLRARLEGRPLRRYRPQRDFLALLNLGGRRALGGKWGVAVSGRAVWRLKDRIDRDFVRRFREGPASMTGAEPMPCGGCAAKLAAPSLSRALARLGEPPPDPSVRLGLAEGDDAAAFALRGGELVLATVDAFRAFTDDPFLVGRVAAVNAVSDVAAKGGRPRHALAVVTVAEEDPARAEETLVQVLSGIRAALDPLGVSLVGGHTTTGPELFVGLSVTGELGAGEPLLTKAGLRPGDALILSKPLGTGVVLAADMQGRASGRVLEAALASMLEPNQGAAAAARAAGARACTDVSGFGLAGHLGELLRASGVSASLDLDALPALPGALELLAAGVRSSAHAQNEALPAGLRLPAGAASHPAYPLLFDPQTSGGLLFGAPSVPPGSWKVGTVLSC
jgi:selenide,water dikinase